MPIGARVGRLGAGVPRSHAHGGGAAYRPLAARHALRRRAGARVSACKRARSPRSRASARRSKARSRRCRTPTPGSRRRRRVSRPSAARIRPRGDQGLRAPLAANIVYATLPDVTDAPPTATPAPARPPGIIRRITNALPGRAGADTSRADPWRRRRGHNHDEEGDLRLADRLALLRLRAHHERDRLAARLLPGRRQRAVAVAGAGLPRHGADAPAAPWPDPRSWRPRPRDEYPLHGHLRDAEDADRSRSRPRRAGTLGDPQHPARHALRADQRAECRVVARRAADR